MRSKKTKLREPKRRNFVALALRQRGAATRTHGPSPKAQRRLDKVSLAREVGRQD